MRVDFLRRPGILAALSVAACLMACRDGVSPVVARPGGIAKAYEPIAGGTIVLNVPNPTSPSVTVALPAFAKRMLLRAIVSGAISTDLTYYNDGAPNQPTQPGAPRSFGPSGFFYGGTPPNVGCGAQVVVSYPSAGGGTSFALPCASNGSTDTTYTAVGFLYSSAVPNGSPPIAGSAVRTGGNPNLGYCFSYRPQFTGNGPCFYYSGTQTVTLDRVVPQFDLQAVPSRILSGDTVTVTASASPSTLGGLSIPWTIDSTRWVPAYGTQWAPCAWSDFAPQNTGSPRTCRRPFTRSGSLTVFATVNGDRVSKTVVIQVIPAKLSLTAIPNEIQSGDSVAFSASVSPATTQWNIQSWEWKPDSGTGGISDQCGWNNNPCKRRILKTGTMKVRATVDARLDSATARVWVGRARPRLHLNANKTSITAGDTVFFSTSADGGAPYSITGWLYRAGASATALCGTGLTCTTPLGASGVMWAFGVVDGEADSASVGITVKGGCSTLRLAPRVSGVALPCTDTTLALNVNCGGPVIRGGRAHCITTLSDPTKAFTILARIATSAADPTKVVRDSSTIAVTAGGGNDWTGEAIITSQVVVSATVDGRPVSGSSILTVASRMGTAPWLPFVPPAEPTPLPWVEPQINPNRTLSYPYPGFQNQDGLGLAWPPKGSIGSTDYTEAVIRSLTALDGPNFTWSTTKDPYTVPNPTIYYAASMEPTDTFYLKQVGGNSQTPPNFCRAADMDTWRARTIAHERAHWQTFVTWVTQHDPVAAFEGIVVYDPLDFAAAKAAVMQPLAIRQATDVDTLQAIPYVNCRMRF